MSINSRSTKVTTALVPRQDLRAALAGPTERDIIDHALVAPERRGIFGLIEKARRDHRAVLTERGLLEQLREQQARHIQARYEGQLELDLGQIVEAVRHQLAMLEVANQKIEMDWAAEQTVEASKARIDKWVKFGEFMKALGVMPVDQVDRMVTKYITMEVDATTNHLATMGGIDGVRRTTEAG